MPSVPNPILLAAQLADIDAQIANVNEDSRFTPGQKHALAQYWQHEREKKQSEIQLQCLLREVKGCRVQHEYSKTPGARQQWQAHEQKVLAAHALGRPDSRSDSPSAPGPEAKAHQYLRQAEVRYNEERNRLDALNAKDTEFREALDALNVKAPTLKAMEVKLQEWEILTPEELRPAIKHVRKTFESEAWNYSNVTQKLCYASLHREGTDPTLLAPYYESAFAIYRKIVGPVAQQEFDELLRGGTPPSVFKAYLDVFCKGLEVEVRKQFDQVLKIALPNSEILRLHHVEWAKSHLQLLINENAAAVKNWIKAVCDKQDRSKSIVNDEDFKDLIFWRTWRAPKLIDMQPSGNTAYDSAAAWAREDELRTLELLEGLSWWFGKFLGIELDKIAGEVHVRLAQGTKRKEFPQGQADGTRGSPINADSIEQQSRRAAESISAATATWETIEISFLSDERVQVRNGASTETCNYGELGFADGRTGKPNQAWETLRALAEERGIIRDGIKTGRTWPKVEKRMQDIRKVLRKHFGISADPIPFVGGTGYQARFKIGCSPSFHT